MCDKKPVWRMNTGKVPVDLGKELIFNDMTIRGGDTSRAIPKSWREDPIYWELSPYKDDLCFYAYQTTRTKAAKYELVDCEECLGGYEGFF